MGILAISMQRHTYERNGLPANWYQGVILHFIKQNKTFSVYASYFLGIKEQVRKTCENGTILFILRRIGMRYECLKIKSNNSYK